MTIVQNILLEIGIFLFICISFLIFEYCTEVDKEHILKKSNIRKILFNYLLLSIFNYSIICIIKYFIK